MTTTALIIAAGCGLGLLQVAAGIAIGMRLGRPRSTGRDADLLRARSLALELHGLTQRIGQGVSQHRSQFEAAEARLRDVPTGKHNPTTDLVVGVVAEILSANRQLQKELNAAETQIADQAREIESHLSTSLTDPLTKLPNRRALDEQLAARLQDYRKHGTPFSVMMVDVDHFKQINDSFGHPMGDQVLSAMGTVLRQSLRQQDFVARFGGEEFAIVFPHTTASDAKRAAIAACQNVRSLSADFEHLERRITASGGLAEIASGEDADSLVRRADEALYRAKRNGRDRSYLHDGTDCVPLEHNTNGEISSAEPAPLDGDSDSNARVAPTSAAMAGACDELREAVLSSVGGEID